MNKKRSTPKKKQEDANNKIYVSTEIDENNVELAFEAGCSVRQAAAFCGVSVGSLDAWCMRYYLMSAQETKDYIADRGISKFRVLVYSHLIAGDLDYHRIYGRIHVEHQKEAKDLATDESGSVIVYEAHLPDDGRSNLEID